MTVRTLDFVGNISAVSTALPVNTPAADVTNPSQPGTPVASNITSGGFTLNWTASTDN